MTEMKKEGALRKDKQVEGRFIDKYQRSGLFELVETFRKLKRITSDGYITIIKFKGSNDKTWHLKMLKLQK